MIYRINPVPKPRMTQRDKYVNLGVRPSVARYRAFCDEVRWLKVKLPAAGAHVTFHLPMPKSWPKKKKALMDGTPHQKVPDLDNLFKALGDAVYGDDSVIYDFRATKLWGEMGAIEIREA